MNRNDVGHSVRGGGQNAPVEKLVRRGLDGKKEGTVDNDYCTGLQRGEMLGEVSVQYPESDMYQSLELYEKNKLRIQTFYIEFARDKKRKDEHVKLA